MIRAGYAVRLRLIGVESLTATIGLGAEVLRRAEDRKIHINIAFENVPSSKMPVLDIPRYVRAGRSGIYITERQLHDQSLGSMPYVWLTITASSIYALPDSIEAGFTANPKATAKEVDSVLYSDVHRDLASVARIVANAFAVHFPGQVARPESEQVLYWAVPNNAETFSVGAHGESIEVGTLTTKDVESALLAVIAAASVRGTPSEAVERALHHYVKARQELAGSLERFLGNVMALEALTATVETDTRPDFATKANALRALVSTSAPELTLFVDGLLNRQPSLNNRFDALAASLHLPSQTADKSLFRNLNRLRGEFAHGRPHDPEGPEETTIAHEADSLALKYISAYLSALKEEELAKGALRLASS